MTTSRQEFITRLRELRGDDVFQEFIARWTEATLTIAEANGHPLLFKYNSEWQAAAIRNIQRWDETFTDKQLMHLVDAYRKLPSERRTHTVLVGLTADLRRLAEDVRDASAAWVVENPVRSREDAVEELLRRHVDSVLDQLKKDAEGTTRLTGTSSPEELEYHRREIDRTREKLRALYSSLNDFDLYALLGDFSKARAEEEAATPA